MSDFQFAWPERAAGDTAHHLDHHAFILPYTMVLLRSGRIDQGTANPFEIYSRARKESRAPMSSLRRLYCTSMNSTATPQSISTGAAKVPMMRPGYDL
ncbi:MAG: hypothetical protein ACRDQG_13060 [Pseudonocardiaceae bacterium]